MRIILIVLFIFCWPELYGQQNLFNIPSGDITPKKKVFFQQQINSYGVKDYESKSHFVYGIFTNTDIGVNFINMPVTISKGLNVRTNDKVINGPLFPALLLTAQTQFKLSDVLKINIGGMYGSNISSRSFTKPLYSIYSITNITIGHRIRILAGPYYSNKYLVGNHNNLGLLAGYEIILSKRIYLMGDYISGRNSSSAIVSGINFNLTKRIQLCSGLLLATPQKEIKPGIVFELNILGYDINH